MYEVCTERYGFKYICMKYVQRGMGLNPKEGYCGILWPASSRSETHALQSTCPVP